MRKCDVFWRSRGVIVVNINPPAYWHFQSGGIIAILSAVRGVLRNFFSYFARALLASPTRSVVGVAVSVSAVEVKNADNNISYIYIHARTIKWKRKCVNIIRYDDVSRNVFKKKKKRKKVFYMDITNTAGGGCVSRACRRRLHNIVHKFTESSRAIGRFLYFS